MGTKTNFPVGQAPDELQLNAAGYERLNSDLVELLGTL
jgi:hypothetical protein